MSLRNRHYISLLVFFSLCIYYPSLFASFNSLDDSHLVSWLLNQDGIPWETLFYPGSSQGYYRPLALLSHFLDKQFWGLEESFMHLGNISLHAANTVLVYCITEQILKRKGLNNHLVSFSAALLFAIHPVNTEAVNWISARTDLMAGFFGLLAILLLFYSLPKNGKLLSLAASTSLFLGCLSKEVAFFLYPPILLYIFASTPGQPSLYRKISVQAFHYINFITSALLYLGLRRLALHQMDTGVVTITGNLPFDLPTNVKMCLKAIGFYAKKLFIPWPLNFAILKVSDYYMIAGVALCLLAIYLIVRRSWVSLLILTSISTGSAALLVLVGRLAWTPVAERYLYLPSATFAIAMLLFVYERVRKDQRFIAMPLLVAVLFAAIAYTTVQRNIIWQSNLSLYEDTVEKSPGSLSARNELAVALFRAGRIKESNAIIKANTVTSSIRNYQFYEMNRANAYLSEGDTAEALRILRATLKNPGKFESQILNMVVNINDKLLLSPGENQKREAIQRESLSAYKRMVEINNDPFICFRAGLFSMRLGRNAEAKRYLKTAYEKAPEKSYYRDSAKKLAEKLK